MLVIHQCYSMLVILQACPMSNGFQKCFYSQSLFCIQSDLFKRQIYPYHPLIKNFQWFLLVLRKETETLPGAFSFLCDLFSAHLWTLHAALSAFPGAPSQSACSLNSSSPLPPQDLCTCCLSLRNTPYQAPRRPASPLRFITPFSWLCVLHISGQMSVLLGNLLWYLNTIGIPF